MTYEQIVAAAKEVFEAKDVSAFAGQHLAVQINITGEGEGVFYIELKDGRLDVQPYEYDDRDVILKASYKTLLGLADGSVNAVAAFTIGKLKIDGPIEKALEFQKILESK